MIHVFSTWKEYKFKYPLLFTFIITAKIKIIMSSLLSSLSLSVTSLSSHECDCHGYCYHHHHHHHQDLSKAITLTQVEALNPMADDTKYSIQNVIILTSYHLLYFFSHLLLVNVCSLHLLMKLHFHFWSQQQLPENKIEDWNFSENPHASLCFYLCEKKMMLLLMIQILYI